MNVQQPVLVACPLCGGNQAREWAVYPELNWVRCECSLIYKRSEAPDPKAAEFYEDNYFLGRRYTLRTRRRISKSCNQILDMLNFAPPGPLLDIGCSVGYTLVAARRLGLTATGTDLSQYAIKACRDQGFRAEPGALAALPFAADEFGLITMKHVLEHTPDPRAALQDVRRILRPGGALFIAVPHADYRKSVRNPQASRYFLPAVHGREHFVYYTPETMTRLLQEEGFRIVSVHPQLWHRRVGVLRQIGELLLSPLRWAAQWIVGAAAVRKEFWLVAIRDSDAGHR
jgi:SAM-dependent methyltransferase